MATVKEQDLEKQIGNHIGCMAGFLHIFDRPHILSPKRFHSPQRLPLSPNAEYEASSVKSSPSRSKELMNQKQNSRSPTPELRSPAPEFAIPATEDPTRSPLTLPILEFKEGARSPWRFSKEAPRLSLDSRAIIDVKGSLKPRQIREESGLLPANQRDTTEDERQRRSTNVIARLMGLEPLPSSDSDSPQKAELRRSASESRVCREYRFVDGLNFQAQQSSQNLRSDISIPSNPIREEKTRNGDEDPMECFVRSTRAEPARVPPQQRCFVRRKNFFDSTDFFPEPKKTASIYGELEKRIKRRGLDEHPNDLETLRQLLEALQLKGLLHSSNQPQARKGSRNFVFDNYDPPVKPARSPVHPCQSGDSSPSGSRSGARARAVCGGTSPSMSPRWCNRGAADRAARSPSKERVWVSPTSSESSVKSPSGRQSFSEQQRRISPIQPPKAAWRRPEPVQTVSRSNRGRTAQVYSNEDGFSSIIGTCSQDDEEIWKVEEYNIEGKSLLERCDKLLHSIREMTAVAATESQPSPVSVLDTSIYHEESSPSPVMKRSLDFTEQPVESEDETWGSVVSSADFKSSDDSEFTYISDILRASKYLPEDTDIFLLLEKQQDLKGKCTSKFATQGRRLIFDTIEEILNRRRKLPPWRAIFCLNSDNGKASLQQIWSEFRKIRDRSLLSGEDLVNVICSVLRRDFSEDATNGWEDQPVEMSEAVLDLERLIFKDLITETIRHLAVLSDNSSRFELLRRRLVF